VITIDLSGSDGNAFALSAIAKIWSGQLARPLDKPLVDGAKSYEDVLNRFDKLFKGVVDYSFLHDPRDAV